MRTRLESCVVDLRHAVRSLRRSPTFASITIMVLALAIGANGALFSIVHGVLMRELPYRDADRLVVMTGERQFAQAAKPVGATFRLVDLRDLRATLSVFDAFVSVATDGYVLTTSGGSEVVQTAIVSNTFFPTFGARLIAGRALDASDDRVPTVVISERLARRLFGTPPQALGSSLTLNGRAYTVVGLIDKSFAFPAAITDAWTSAEYENSVKPRGFGFHPIGHLRPGATIDQARAEIDTAVRDLAATHPRMFGNSLRMTAVDLRQELVGGMRQALVVLWAAVGLVLVVSGANVVNLLLARNADLAREHAMRQALGASAGRLFQRDLIDAAVLTLAGTALGLLLAAGVVSQLTRWEPADTPLSIYVSFGWPTLAFAAMLGVLTTVVMSVPSAWSWATPPARLVVSGLGAGRQRIRLRRLLCVAELAVAMILLVSATLLGRSLVRLLQTDLGVDTRDVTVVSLDLDSSGHRTDAAVVQLADRLAASARQLPGVRAAGISTGVPPNAGGLVFTLKRTSDDVDYAATAVMVSPGFFESMGVRLVKGRLFTASDDLASPPVVIVSATTARRLFPDSEALGRTIPLPTLRDGKKGGEAMTVVGVIADIKYSGIAAPADDQVYRPFAQQPFPSVYFVTKTDPTAENVAQTLRRHIATIDPSVVVASIQPLSSVISEEVTPPRLRTLILTAMALLSLAIAAVGLYGVIAYAVSQRTRELALRQALGASPGALTAMVLREGLLLGVIGGAVGSAAALLVTRALQTLIYGVSATDALSFLLAAALLLLVTLAASYVPARRAARLDPLAMLKAE